MKHSNQKKASPYVLSRVKTNTPRNAFNMSFDSYMHSPVGLLLPNFVQDIKPNDYFTLDVSSFTRTVPVNTAAFCRMTEYTDFYFVPMSLIWKPFDQMISPVPDVNSALQLASQADNNVNSMPYFTMTQLMEDLFANPDAGKLPQDKLFNILPKAYAARLLDQLGYFSNNQRCWISDKNEIGFDTNVATQWNQDVGSMFSGNYRFNPYRILAFNRILSDYYRQTDYTSSDPRLFNIDDIDSGTGLPSSRLRAFLRCQLPSDQSANWKFSSIFPFVKWNLDALTACKPSQLYGSFSNPSGLNASPEVSFDLVHSNGGVWSNYNDVSHGVSNTQDLRISRALEKLARVSMSAPKTFRAQQEAHFGVSSDSCDNCSTRYLGTYRTDLEIGEVIATTNYDSQDASNYLGQVAGKGTCTGRRNGVIKMHSKEFGVIIGIHYIKPEAEYQCNRMNQLVSRFSRSDFFVPEFDQLGLEPQYQGIYHASASHNFDVLGYQSRYSNLKSRVTEVHGNFQKGRNLSQWAMARNYGLASPLDASIQRFFVDPRVTATIFEVNSDGTEITDQFISHYRFDATLVSDMSVNGTPTL